MKRLELIKGLSYSTRTFSAKKAVPFDVEDDMAEKLMETGRFEELESILDAEDKDKPIEKMNKSELEALAAEKGIDISACKNNADRAETIKAAIADAEDKDKPIEEMTDEELAAYAVENGIDVSECTSREEVLSTISTALAMQ
ncbi:MAG: hypothetical protein PHN80_06130 [Hespellia sp.]|nr:hypothetical protein [Hespellia sp.]